MSVASVGNEIIAALGLDRSTGDTFTTRIYDIASNTWSFGANAPGVSSEGAGIAHGGLFYNVGGRGSLVTPTGARDDIWSYDPNTDTWNAALSPMPTPRAGLAVAVVGNAIYAIGGRSNTGGPCSGLELAAVERYDIDTDTWAPVAPLPSARSDLAATTAGGKIYIFGGCDPAGNILADVDVYDPVTDTWSSSPTDMPTSRAGMYAVAKKGGTVHVIGGWDGVFPFDLNPATSVGSLIEAYKVSQDAWTTPVLPPMPTPRAETGAADHGGSIYIVGGAQPGFGASVDDNEVFKP
jgi:N-acetylneuraminic acid mutarotase